MSATFGARLARVLVEFDGPQLVLLSDAVGTEYLGVLVEQGSDTDRFFCVPVSQPRFLEVLSGALDLREAFVSAEIPIRCLASLFHSAGDGTRLEMVHVDEIVEAWLPLPGLALEKLLDERVKDHLEVAQVATAKMRAVVDFSMEPPESRLSPVITVDHLAGGIAAFQRLVRYAFRKALSGLPREIRDILSVGEGVSLETFGFASGSFRVLLQSSAASDLFGKTPLSYAMDLVDEALSLAKTPELAVEFLRENSGHFVSAFRDFVQYSAESDVQLSYTWCEPGAQAPVHRELSPSVAAALYGELVRTEDLVLEQITIQGVFTRVDVNGGRWTVRLLDDTELRGELADGVGPILSGVVVETQQYSLSIEERAEEAVVSGKLTPRRLLTSLRPVL